MQDRLDNKQNKQQILSPYLNFDPSILRPSGSSQFIIPEGQGETRGKMEMAFFTIGSSVVCGGLFGNVSGLITGLKETKSLTGKIRYSQLINFVTKQGSTSAQTFGCLALMFSLYDTLLSTIRETDDEFNTVASGFLTGITYGSPHGLKRMAKGGILGLALTLTYIGYDHFDYLKSKLNNSSKN